MCSSRESLRLSSSNRYRDSVHEPGRDTCSCIAKVSLMHVLRSAKSCRGFGLEFWKTAVEYIKVVNIAPADARAIS